MHYIDLIFFFETESAGEERGVIGVGFDVGDTSGLE